MSQKIMKLERIARLGPNIWKIQRPFLKLFHNDLVLSLDKITKKSFGISHFLALKAGLSHVTRQHHFWDKTNLSKIKCDKIRLWTLFDV